MGGQFKVPKRFGLKVSAIQEPRNTRLDRKEWYPVMCGVKQTNVRRDTIASAPVPIGWMFYNRGTPNSVFYSSNRPDNLVNLLTFDTTISFENKNPTYYSPFITRQGDIIWVWRGWVDGTEAAKGRQNPIVYPYNDLTSPVVVDLSSYTAKPTAWLQNCGADFNYVSTKNYLIFAEYTRLIHSKAYIWKVVSPYTDPANWSIVYEKDMTSVDGNTGFKHWHMINIDPYTNDIYAASGDDDDNAKIYVSTDEGVTWSVVLEGAEAKARVLNLIFTKDYIYWASDARFQHILNRVGRDANKHGDFATYEVLAQLPPQQATYTTCLLHDPPGLLMLDYFDYYATSYVTGPLKVQFWSFETNSLHTISEINYIPGGIDLTKGGWGFRCDAVSFYQNPVDKRIICGFRHSVNRMDLLNATASEADDNMWNLGLEVVRL